MHRFSGWWRRWGVAIGPGFFAALFAAAAVAMVKGEATGLAAVLGTIAAFQLALTIGLLRSARVRAAWSRWAPSMRHALIFAIVAVFALRLTISGSPLWLIVGMWAFVLLQVFVLVVLIGQAQGKLPTAKEHPMTQWWYNHKTKQVEEGPQSLGSDRDGPYATREDAARAPEIAAERSRRWAADDAASD